MVNTLHLPVHKKFTKNFCEGITYIELNNIFPITLFFMCCPLLSFANSLCSFIIFSVCKSSQPQLTIPCVLLHLLYTIATHHRHISFLSVSFWCTLMIIPVECKNRSEVNSVRVRGILMLCAVCPAECVLFLVLQN